MNDSPRILYPVRLLFRFEGIIHNFLDNSSGTSLIYNICTRRTKGDTLRQNKPHKHTKLLQTDGIKLRDNNLSQCQWPKYIN